MSIWTKGKFKYSKMENKVLLEVLKAEFNKNILRYNKALKYYAAESTTLTDINKTIDEFVKIHNELMVLANEYEEIVGYKLDEKIMLEGFDTNG